MTDVLFREVQHGLGNDLDKILSSRRDELQGFPYHDRNG